jgi:hypothetical protein
MFRIGSVLLLASLCAGAAFAQSVSRTVCSEHRHQCVTYFTDGTSYTSQYYPYRHPAPATSTSTTAHSQYDRYLRASTATTPYGTYYTQYNPYLNSSTTTGTNGYQQQCDYNVYLQTYQCR